MNTLCALPALQLAAGTKALGRLALIRALAVAVGLLVGNPWPVLTVAALGVVAFTPQHDFVGQASFDYTVTGPGGLTRIAKALQTLPADNDASADCQAVAQRTSRRYAVSTYSPSRPTGGLTG